jgi:hypothetical protein
MSRRVGATALRWDSNQCGFCHDLVHCRSCPWRCSRCLKHFEEPRICELSCPRLSGLCWDWRACLRNTFLALGENILSFENPFRKFHYGASPNPHNRRDSGGNRRRAPPWRRLDRDLHRRRADGSGEGPVRPDHRHCADDPRRQSLHSDFGARRDPCAGRLSRRPRRPSQSRRGGEGTTCVAVAANSSNASAN